MVKYLTLVALIVFTSCGQNVTHNTLSKQEVKEGWYLLFDGKTTNGWHLYNQGSKTSAWKVVNGELYCKQDSSLAFGDLVTDKSYQNFELLFDWKIGEGGNSGVFINVVEHPYNPTAWASAPEYQLLDHAHPDYEVAHKKTGNIFGFPLQHSPVSQKPSGEWNQSKIIQQNGKVQFYLNGVLTTEQDFNATEWKNMIKETHFQHFNNFGQQTRGQIGLQYWVKEIWFRNIKIKEL